MRNYQEPVEFQWQATLIISLIQVRRSQILFQRLIAPINYRPVSGPLRL
jgi:hypothetical protein